ncbi:MAG: YjgP/YjgQ family permease [Ignavibacteria bacterium]|nr:YjgP/YjgQ family permease [Ignavibacteria bacterium]
MKVFLNLVDRYILRLHLPPFLFGFITVIFLFLLQFIIRYIDELVGKGLSEWIIIQLIFLNIAWMVVLAAPMGALFSSLLSFGSMSASHEITIVKASGGSLLRMMMPVIIAGFALSYFLFWFNDAVLPDSNYKVKDLMNDIRRKKPTFNLESGIFSTELEGYTILARQVDSLSGLLRGVTIYDNTKSPNLNIISSDTGKVEFSSDMSKLVMTLFNGEIIQMPAMNSISYRKVLFNKYQAKINASGFAFERSSGGMSSRGDRELCIKDMQLIVTEAMKNAAELDGRINNEIKRNFESLFSFDNSSVAPQVNPRFDENSQNTTNLLKKDTVNKIKKRNLKPRQDKAKSIVNADPEDFHFKRKVKPKKQKPDIKQIMIADSIAVAKRQMAMKMGKNPEINPPEHTGQFKPPEKAIDTFTAKSHALKRITFLYSSISSDIYRQHDYKLHADQYRVEIYKKYAIPFACLIFILVGCPLGILTKGGNFGLSAAISLAFYIFYWACLIGGEKLADRGYITPFVAMWGGNFIVGVMGIILSIKVSNESFRLPFLNRIRKLRSKKNW